MKTTVTCLPNKFGLLLAVLLCSLLVIAAVPVVAQAASFSPEATYQNPESNDTTAFVLAAGEVSPGEPEAILLLDKALVLPLLHALLQHLYADFRASEVIPTYYHFSKGDSGIHTILTKGP